jgi:hypothetical protein
MINWKTIKWIAIGLCVAAAFGAGWSWNGARLQAAWDAEKAELNAKAVEAVQAAMNNALETEREAARRIAVHSAQYQIALKERQGEEADAIDRARTGGLFINAKCSSGGDGVSEATSGASGRNGATRVELPKEDGEFLIRLAAEADRITEQLKACQAILEQERK